MPIHPAFAHPYTFWVFSRMASIKSRQEEPKPAEGKNHKCHGHGCGRTNCCKGYGHAIKGGHGRDSQGQIPSKDYAELRHPYNKWRL